MNRTVEQNLSWDTLLTTKEYVAYAKQPDTYSINASDVGFFRSVWPSLPFDSSGSLPPNYLSMPVATEPSYPVRLSPDDTRVSGILTTSRFIGRYTNTGINRNRRRAAAIFKIFMCDTMVPAIGAGADRRHEFIEATFAENFDLSENQIAAGVAASAQAKHGSDPACAACHYKLDPMGRVFQNIGLVSSNISSPGALVFKHVSDNSMVNVPLRGIGDLGREVVKQPEYVDCQVRWFWKQFVGQDVPLTNAKRTEWIQKFESVGRRTNDFIALLVTSDEFKRRPISTEIVTFDRVELLLKRCDNCHTTMPTIPTFAKLPIGFDGDQEEHNEWTASMLERLSRNDGARGKMPRDRAGWSDEEITLLKTWLSQGAPDDRGHPTVSGGAS